MKDRRVRSRQREPGTNEAPRRIGFAGGDGALVGALRSGHPGGPAELFDRYGAHVERVLAAVLGVDPELPDLLHEVFARAFADIATLDDPDRLKAWLTSIAVFTARGCIRRRHRGRWLRFWAPDTIQELSAASPMVTEPPLEAREALAAVRRVLDGMSEAERIAFSLRFIAGLEMTDVAAACQISLSSLKRRLAQAEGHFVELARREPVLSERLGDSARWRSR